MADTRTLAAGSRMPLADFITIFDGLFTTESYRLETLDYYDSALYRRWLAGEPYDRSEWDDWLAGCKRAGKTVSRCHLLPDVLTDYLVHELAFYRGSVLAGEDIRLMRKADAPGIPIGDYYLFDRKLAALMEYDSKGVCTSVTLTSEPADVERCVRWRDEAMVRAVTLADYDREATA